MLMMQSYIAVIRICVLWRNVYNLTCMDAVAAWLCSSCLCLNVGKSNCLLIGSRQRVANETLHVSVGGNRLTQVNSVRYLGVFIDSTLSWTWQIFNMVARIRYRLASIARYGSLTSAVLCVLYSGFVMPLSDYCDVVWSPTTARLNCLIERIHSKFVKKLLLPYHLRLSFTLTEQRRYHTALQVFRSLRQIPPPYLHHIFPRIFQFSKDLTGRVGRNINRLFVLGKRSFFYRGAVLWNCLPLNVSEAASVPSF